MPSRLSPRTASSGSAAWTWHDVAEITKDMLACSLAPEGLPDMLWDESEGNPFFIAEYLGAAVARGLLKPDGPRRWRLSAQSPDAAPARLLGLPRSLHELLEVRLEGLTPEARRVLELAAVLGREFEVRWLESAFGEHREYELLDDLVRRQILEATGPGKFRFLHDKFREAIEADITPEERVALHRTAAERLETLAESAAEGISAAVIGTHYARAGMPDKALRHLLEGARSARAAYVTSRAIELYRLAHAQTRAIGATAAEEARRIAETLGDLLTQTGQHGEGRAFYASARDSAPADDRLSRARLQRKIANSHWTLLEHEASEAAFALAEAHLGSPEALTNADEAREWIEIQQGRFSARYFARQTGDATEGLLQALQPVVERYGTPLQRTMFWQRATSDLLARTQFAYSDAAVALARRGIAECAGDATPVELAQANFGLGFALILGGRSHAQAGIAALELAAAQAERLDERVLLTRVLAYLAVGHRLRGDVERTEAIADKTWRLCQSTQLAWYVGVAEACRGWCEWQRGHSERALAHAERALHWWADSLDHFPFRWLASLVALDLHRGEERVEAALPLLEDLLQHDQQKLPEPLSGAIADAREQCANADLVAALRSLDRVSHVARELGHL